MPAAEHDPSQEIQRQRRSESRCRRARQRKAASSRRAPAWPPLRSMMAPTRGAMSPATRRLDRHAADHPAQRPAGIRDDRLGQHGGKIERTSPGQDLSDAERGDDDRAATSCIEPGGQILQAARRDIHRRLGARFAACPARARLVVRCARCAVRMRRRRRDRWCGRRPSCTRRAADRTPRRRRDRRAAWACSRPRSPRRGSRPREGRCGARDRPSARCCRWRPARAGAGA